MTTVHTEAPAAYPAATQWWPQQAPGWGRLATDIERDWTLTTLATAAQIGQLRPNETTDRTDAALRARTVGELAGLIQDLGVPMTADAAAAAAGWTGTPGPVRATPKQHNSMATAALWLGAASTVLVYFVIPAIIAVAIGAVALGELRADRTKRYDRPRAMAGIALGIISLLVGIALHIYRGS